MVTDTRSRAVTVGGTDRILDERAITEFVAEQLARIDALGTDERGGTRTRLGYAPGELERTYPDTTVVNDAVTGEERLRMNVTLATGIPEEVCRAVNLGYRDPATVDVSAFGADADTLVVRRAGEVLFRLR